MRKLTGLNALILSLSLLMVAGCTPRSPYAQGKSAADIPAHVDVIYLKEVTMSYGQEKNGDPKPEVNPSQNDQEVTAMVKRNIVSQLTNYGYKVVEDTKQKADIELRFFIFYMPERVLAGRTVGVGGFINDKDGTTMFKSGAMQQNTYGLIGAMVGPSRDEMVSAAAREAVIKVVTEMRKGTKENVPVAQTATQAPTPTPPVIAPLPATKQ